MDDNKYEAILNIAYGILAVKYNLPDPKVNGWPI